MGAGASSQGSSVAAASAAKGARSGGGAGGSGQVLSASGTTTVVDVVEGGVQWLVGVVDREKQEKEWLAARFEEKCNEVNTLYKEVATLRAQLEAARHSGGTGLARSLSERSLEEKKSPGLAPAPAAEQHAMPPLPGRAGSPSNSKSLVARRGMKLGIDTSGPGGARRPAPSSAVVLSSDQPVSPVQEKPEQEAAAMKEGAFVEPMSALLRRRTEDWSTAEGTTDAQRAIPKEPEKKEEDMPEVIGPCKSLKNLCVAPQKVFNLLDEDCPASPKRVMRKHSFEAGGGGSGGTG